MANLPSYIDFGDGRLSQYQNNEDLFEGKAWEVFGVQQYEWFKMFNPANPRMSYVNYNVFSLVSRLYADMIWGESPKVEFKDQQLQDWFDNWREEVDFDVKGYEASLSASYYGDAVFKVSTRETYPGSGIKQVVVDQIDPCIWFPDVDEESAEPPKSHTLLFEKKIGNDQRAYLLEIYTYGEIIYESYALNNGEYKEVDPNTYFADELANVATKTRTREDGEVQYYIETGCQYPLIVNIPNLGTPSHFFGVPDYSDDVKSLSYAINQNLTAIQSIIMKHADPMLVVPDSAIKQAIQDIGADKTSRTAQNYGFGDTETFNTTVQTQPNIAKQAVASQVIQNTKVMGLPSDGSGIEPKYVTWDAQLEAIFTQIKELKESVMQACDVSPILINPDKSTGNLSGIALKRLAYSTINRAKRKQMYLKAGLKQLFYIVQEVAKNNGVIFPNAAPETPTIRFNDGLPNDLAEMAQTQQLLLDAGIQTTKDAVAYVYDMNEQQAIAKVTEIDKEKTDKMATFMPDGLQTQSNLSDNQDNNAQ